MGLLTLQDLGSGLVALRCGHDGESPPRRGGALAPGWVYFRDPQPTTRPGGLCPPERGTVQVPPSWSHHRMRDTRSNRLPSQRLILVEVDPFQFENQECECWNESKADEQEVVSRVRTGRQHLRNHRSRERSDADLKT